MSDEQPIPVPPSTPATASGGGSVSNQLLFGAIGAFLLLAAASSAMMQRQMIRSESLFIVFALIGAIGFVGLGFGMLALGRLDIPQGKAAAPVLFIMAVVALLPLVAVMAKSLPFLRIALTSALVGGAVAWSLTGLALQQGASQMGTLAKVAGILLLITAIFDVSMFALKEMRIVRGRSAAEVILTIGYIFAAMKMAALLLTGVSLINLRAKQS